MIEARKVLNNVVFTVTNSGVGLASDFERHDGHGVGLSNLRSRLQLHYGDASTFEMNELDGNHVSVRIEIPVQYSDALTTQSTRFGVE